jgi:transcriptional regulator with XRE-family HTH domain
MDETPPLSTLAAGYGARLKGARRAVARSAKALAEEFNISPQRWSHWERERHPPDFYTMLALKHRHHISLDWIYSGDWRNLPGNILQSLLHQAKEPDAPRALIVFEAQFLAGTHGLGNLAVNERRERFKRG